jgi:hypothetical protein
MEGDPHLMLGGVPVPGRFGASHGSAARNEEAEQG